MLPSHLGRCLGRLALLQRRHLPLVVVPGGGRDDGVCVDGSDGVWVRVMVCVGGSDGVRVGVMVCGWE